MHPLYDKFCKLCEELAIKNRIDPILAELYAKRDKLEAELNALRAALQKEQTDVDKIESVTVSSIFYTVIGQKDRKLEKEKSEAAAAEEAFSASQSELSELNGSIKKYEHELRTVRGCDLRYGKLLPQILDEIKASDTHEATAVIDTFDSLTRVEEKFQKLDEALELCRDALANARDIAQYIAKADYYSKRDHKNFSGNDAGYDEIQKYTSLESAQPIAGELTAQIKRLDASLVGELLDFEMDIEIPFSELLRDSLGVNRYMHDRIENWKIEIDCLVPHLEKVHEKLITARDRWAKVADERRTELHEQIKVVLE
jgi:tetratricopeptide (TPR) repeat protein